MKCPECGAEYWRGSTCIVCGFVYKWDTYEKMFGKGRILDGSIQKKSA